MSEQASVTIERHGAREVPAVSVCIPLYDKERYIARTVASILDQTFTDFELVIVDNASEDGSLEVVRGFDDPRIVLVRSDRTVPMYESYTRAVAMSRAPLVKLINADDRNHPSALERQVAELGQDPSLAMVTCRQNMIDDEDRIVAPDRALRTPDLVGRQERATIARRLVRHGGNPIGNPGSVLFRRAAFEACGGFPEQSFVMDVGLWLRLLDHGAYYGIPESLADFRLSIGSASSSAGRRNIRTQQEFARGLRRSHGDVVRPRDIAFGALRAPLVRARHHVIYAASSPPSSLKHRLAARLMAPQTTGS